ncbi:MAG TPA: hypothetical protein VKU02_22900 [Gemmataceae bacterium]|nr:hypothetical protein [Gemmataceae bacterium]
MPDPKLILEAIAAAGLTAAAVLLLCAGLWRSPRPKLASAGSVVGLSLGMFIGCWWIGLRPHWPPQEDQDRLLFLLLPILAGIELVAAVAGRSGWLVWLLRFGIAASAAPILLYHSSYLTDLAGPGTREWTPTQTWMILGGLAAALAGVWMALVLLARRIAPAAEPGKSKGHSVLFAVAIAVAGAAITIMLSGYASGGEIGLPLAAALAGIVAASLALRQPFPGEGALSLGIVGLFALLVIGRFFGQLATAHGALLFFGLLLCWLPELPRGLARVVLVTVPVAVALALAQHKFAEDSGRTSSGAPEPSIQDYLDFGK